MAIVQRSIRHYRRGFYTALRDRLTRDGIELELFHSNLPPELDPRPDAWDVPWSVHLPRRTIRVAGRGLLWQPYHHGLREADLVIVEQATDLALNYRLLVDQLRGRTRVGMWGHGRNFSSEASRTGELIKRRTSTSVHWWFAYTERSSRIVADLGFPPDRITVVNNAIDTGELAADIAWARTGPARALREELRVGDGALGVFIGTLRASKRLDLLLAAAEGIRASRPDFHLMIVGGGELMEALRARERRDPWLHVLGPQFGRDRARALAAADLAIIPGAVGLGVLDSFVSATPLITSADGDHGPEITYLRDRDNGRLVEGGDDPSLLAEAALEVLDDERFRRHLVAGCEQDAVIYSTEAMADRFAEGIRRALDAPPR